MQKMLLNDYIVIAQLKYNFSQDDMHYLSDILNLQGILELIEDNLLSIEDLFKRDIKEVKFISIQAARRIVESAQIIKSKKLNLKISDIIIWLKYKNSWHAMILSPAAIEIINNDSNSLLKIKNTAILTPDKMYEWDVILGEIFQVSKDNNISHKRVLAHQILSKIYNNTSELPFDNDIILKEQFSLTNMLKSFISAVMLSIEKAASAYFTKLYNNDNKQLIEMSVIDKADGLQLGTVVEIKYNDSHNGTTHQIKYFVKTHQNGSRDDFTQVSIIDLKELFLYKVFEYIGFGPKVHFIINPQSPTDLLIATQNAEFTKRQNEKMKFFKTYNQLDEEMDTRLQQKNPISPELATGLTQIEILNRIFVLKDLTINQSNYGLVTYKDKSAKWNILDFKIDNKANYIIRKIFEGYIQGYGMKNHSKFLSYILNQRNEKDILSTLSSAMNDFENGILCHSKNGRKLSLPHAIDKALLFTLHFIKENACNLNINPSIIFGNIINLTDEEIICNINQTDNTHLPDLFRYFKDVKQNYLAFISGIKIKQHEFAQKPAESNNTIIESKI